MKNLNFKNFELGLTNEIISEIHPLVESNKESLLIQLLTCFGNCIGRKPHFKAAADKHFTNLFVLLVGKSSRGRKGQSLNMIKNLFEEVDSAWTRSNIAKGLSSSEGLVFRLKDEIFHDADSGVDILTGIKDKRLLCIETEFSSVLRQSQRDGNTLSQIIRDAWDSGNFEIMTKNSPMRVTDPMISIIGHITVTELLKTMSVNDAANGFSNRFIFIKAESDKCLPDPPELNPETKKYLISKIQKAVIHAQSVQIMNFNDDAKAYWNIYYKSINQNDASLVGSLTAREEPQVRRLAMILSLMKLKNSIDLDSLKFAIEIYEYSKQSLYEIYGQSLGDPFIDKVKEILSSRLSGATKTEIHEMLSNNYRKNDLDRALRFLKNLSLADSKSKSTGGRPQEIWYLIQNINEIY